MAMIDELISRIRGGRGGALVLRGEPGIGKTALLDAFAARASDATVLRASGVEPERELPFAAVHRMCADLLVGSIDDLPAPQGAAVRVAFGLGEAEGAPDPFLVGLGVLNRLSFAAEERPLLCLIDDAQWLDRASAQALAFAARRLDADPIAVIFAVREPMAQLDGLPEHLVPGLSPADSRALLASRIPAPLDERMRERFIDETHGNPLALLELPRGFSAAELAGGLGIESSGSSRVANLLEESFGRRAEALPADTMTILRIAAAEPTGDPALLWRAAALLGVDPEGAAPAEGADLIAIGKRVVFRHPAVRSVIYRSAEPRERRRIHRALADATDPVADPDRRAWHLARGTIGHDEEVAAALARSAERAQGRGGMAASAAFLGEAAALTPDPRRRTERALAAAQLHLVIGSGEDAAGLLSVAEGTELDDEARIRLELTKVRLDSVGRSDPLDAVRLLEMARRLEPIDADLAVQAYMEALAVALVARTTDGRTDVATIATAAREVAGLRSSDHSEPRRLLLEAAIEMLRSGPASGARPLREALAEYREAVEEHCVTGSLSRDGSAARWLSLGVYCAVALWDFEAWDALTDRQIDGIGRVGDLAMLTFALTSRALMLNRKGDLAGASSLVAEIELAAEVTAAGLPPYAAIALHARSAPEQEAKAALRVGIDSARARGEGLGAAFLHSETAFLANGLGHYADALESAQLADRDSGEGPTLWLPELIEAAVHSGRQELAADALERLSAATRAAGGDWARGVEARSRALLESDEGLFAEAIDRLGRSPARVDLARAHLLYGEWLRREGRRRQARDELRAAHATCEEIGLLAFAQRAARELAATGARVRRRTPESRDALTEREAQIARLAATGLSNRRIGEQLFISHRTVGYHLGKVFTKLDVDNRAQLSGVLTGSATGDQNGQGAGATRR